MAKQKREVKKAERKEKRATKKATKKAKKKDLDISIDTANVDIDIERKDGKFTAKLDTKKFDVTIAKDENGVEVDVTATTKFGQSIGKIITRVITRKRGS